MPISARIVICLLAGITSLATAEQRPWKSADGLRTLQGEFVKRSANTVTIKPLNRDSVTIELEKLHPDERKWLDTHHSLTAPGSAAVPDPAAFFDTLTFSDTRDSTLTKLKASQLVVLTTDETFIGRSGLNGVFRTRQNVGSLETFLYFDWTAAGSLRELTLQTEPIQLADYKERLEPSWEEFIELMSALYGNPVQKGKLPQADSLADGAFMPSHFWNLEGGGSALLGTARDGKRFQLVVRFTQKKIQLVEIP
jgi:hypothetical protein